MYGARRMRNRGIDRACGFSEVGAVRDAIEALAEMTRYPLAAETRPEGMPGPVGWRVAGLSIVVKYRM
jgi:hypothetical protein